MTTVTGIVRIDQEHGLAWIEWEGRELIVKRTSTRGVSQERAGFELLKDFHGQSASVSGKVVDGALRVLDKVTGLIIVYASERLALISTDDYGDLIVKRRSGSGTSWQVSGYELVRSRNGEIITLYGNVMDGAIVVSGR